MTTLNFNVPLKLIDGKDSDKSLASVLSELIGNQTEGKTLKLYGWHKTLQVGDELNLDDSDLSDLKNLIEKDQRYLIFVKGQLLEVLK